MDWKHILQLVLCVLIVRSSNVHSGFIDVVDYGAVGDGVIDVMDYGAVGDGMTDDSPAFSKAWEAVCGVNSSKAILNVPQGKKFLLVPLKFVGPCKSSNLYLLVKGEIIAPSKLPGYDVKAWLSFQIVNGLTVTGTWPYSRIDGRGAVWWSSVHEVNRRPTALEFETCNNLEISGTTHVDSPRNHIAINSCTNVTIRNLHVSAPETSLNTDGIDIASSSNIQIRDSYIGTGDDCIAINSGCNNINITGVTCGPGHGISVGSLGMNGDHAEVEEIFINNCTFNATLNGARIKTWQGGSGFARKIVFDTIKLIDAYNPIIIDQYYCPSQGCTNKTSAVDISGISFVAFRGTSMNNEAVKLSCSENHGCTNLFLAHINITSSAGSGGVVNSSCSNAHGTYMDSIPKVDCLLP